MAWFQKADYDEYSSSLCFAQRSSDGRSGTLPRTFVREDRGGFVRFCQTRRLQDGVVYLLLGGLGGGTFEGKELRSVGSRMKGSDGE